MVVAEHLNWHDDMNEYITAKAQLFANQQPDDIAIYYAHNDNSLQVVSASKGHHIPYMAMPGALVKDDAMMIDNQLICQTDELKLLGKHNWQNVCAAVTAAWQIKQDIPVMRKVLTNFQGLEHRLEFVREYKGIKYYDDSFGTTPETAIVAIEAFSQPVVTILGGSDKGSDYQELAKTVKKHQLPAVITIGEMGPVIAEALLDIGYAKIIPGGSSMTDIVAAARKAANPGSVVLLSTACASFDLFKDYKDRGNQFKQAVQSLV